MSFTPSHSGPKGELVEVLYLATAPTSRRRFIVYRDQGPANTWVRPYHEFLTLYVPLGPPAPKLQSARSAKRELRKLGMLS
jgi:hypothetical protein